MVTAHRRSVMQRLCLDEGKACPKCLAQPLGVVARNGKTAARLRPIERESADDSVSSGTQRFLEARDISGLIVSGGKEVKGGTVMPDVVAA